MTLQASDAVSEEDQAPSTRRERIERAKLLRGRAIGPTAAPANPDEYKVTIYYREPGYAQRNGAAEQTYRGSFIVQATDEQAAVRRAVSEFDQMARLSSVSWIRVIEKVVCERWVQPSPAS